MTQEEKEKIDYKIQAKTHAKNKQIAESRFDLIVAIITMENLMKL